MAQKTVKKPVAKAAAKKAPTKKATVKKAPAKKAPVKKTAAAAATEMKMTTTAPETFACGCGADCPCGGHCAEHHEHRGGFGRFIKKLIIVLIVFALGFAAAKMFCCHKAPHMRGPRAEFVNGCLDASSVKCPKMLEALPAMDANGDDCITRDEFRAFKKQMRREMRADD